MLSPIRSMALAAAALLLAAPAAFSQDKGKPAPKEQTGLEVGDKAPKFTLKDQEGKNRSLDELLRRAKSPWCSTARPIGDRSAAGNWFSCNATSNQSKTRESRLSASAMTTRRF